MSVRSTMADLITRTRLLIADPAGPSELFDSQTIQDALDAVREDVFNELLELRVTLTTSGIQYNDYYAKRGYWESDATLKWGDFSTLTPATSDYVVGHWTFNNQFPPVLVTGKRYDLYRAAADLLDFKIASLASTTYNFSASGQSFSRGTIIDNLAKLCASYRRKQWVRTSKMVRSDLAGEGAEMGIANPERQRALAGPVSADVPFLTGE